MNESLKTLRTIHFSLVTLCFVLSMFLLAPNEAGRYEKAATTIQLLLDRKVFRYERDTAPLVDEAVARSDASQRIGKYLRTAGIATTSTVLKSIEAPTQSAGASLLIEEPNDLLIWKRAVDWDSAARIFVPSGLASDPNTISHLSPCSAELRFRHDSPALPSEHVNLFLHYRFGKKNLCIGNSKPSSGIPVSGRFEDIRGTSLREWLRKGDLLRPPLFSEELGPDGKLVFLPEMQAIWPEILGKKPADALAYLATEGAKRKTSVKMFDVELDKSIVGIVAPLLLLIVQISFCLHLRQIGAVITPRMKQELKAFPWIGVFPDSMARICYGFTVVIWPMIVCLGLNFVLFTSIAQALLLIPLSFVTIGFSVKAYRLTMHLQEFLLKN